MASKIEWTDETWNPFVGCRRVSPGCEHCYAEKTVHRGMAPQHKGLTVLGKNGPRWNGAFNIAEKRLDEPMRRKKPTLYFVNSLSDMFFEALPFELVAAMFGVMACSPQHTFQVLTKRPESAATFFKALRHVYSPPLQVCLNAARGLGIGVTPFECMDPPPPWPLPNVWLGVSVEDQVRAESRIPRLLAACPAALYMISQEPQLGPVHYRPEWLERIGWVIVGGESGAGARPFDTAWAKTTIDECTAASVPVFVKQLGSNVIEPAGLHPTERWVAKLEHSKGGDWSEWPEALRRREMPEGFDYAPA